MPRVANAARAVFLDRDGVLNEEVDYLSRVEDLRVLPGVPGALKALRKAGFKLVVISNQSGVARGYFTKARLRELTRAIEERLERHGARIDAFYYCPHGAEKEGKPLCRCRKPQTLLLARAKRRFGLDLSRSYFVGDSTVDVKAAENAGCIPILVRTGKGGRDRRFAVRPAKTAKDLAAAAKWILSNRYF